MQIGELEPNIDRAANLMAMMSAPHRLEILCILSEGEQSVVKLANRLGLSQPAMSHHLKKLKLAGLVDTRRDGQMIFYGLKGEEAAAILDVLHNLYCKTA